MNQKALTKTLAAIILALCSAAYSYFKDGASAPPRSERQSSPSSQQQQPAEPRQQAERQARAPKAPSVAGEFDYYVLSLSWSPSFCASQKPGAQPEQCGAGRRFGFVVHGLWPQFDKGWPQDCDTAHGDRVPEALVSQMLDIMPSRKLVGHEWAKHGSCSGLDPAGYFAAARQARAAVHIPAQFQAPNDYLTTTPGALKQALLAANPQLRDDMLSVTCKDRTLQEVRVCLNKDLSARACGANERRECRSEQLVLPPVRSGSL
jgi:ribonuclease T2